MEVVVETPKWSFVKYKYVNGKFKRALVSPLPTLFNYGFITGTIASDKSPRDVLILGKKLRQGEKLNIDILGNVQFVDDDEKDDKLVSSLYGRISWIDKLNIDIFFRIYAIYKRFYYLVSEKRLATCKYNGYYFK